MSVQVAELAGGILQFALMGAVLVLAAELASRIFFHYYEREKDGE